MRVLVAIRWHVQRQMMLGCQEQCGWTGEMRRLRKRYFFKMRKRSTVRGRWIMANVHCRWGTFSCEGKSVYPVNRLQMLISVSWGKESAMTLWAVSKTNKPKRVKKIPDSLEPTSSRANQSALTCVCVSGRLSSRTRFPNWGLVSEIAILVLATAAGALTPAGNWMRSGTATNTQPGIFL